MTRKGAVGQRVCRTCRANRLGLWHLARWAVVQTVLLGHLVVRHEDVEYRFLEPRERLGTVGRLDDVASVRGVSLRTQRPTESTVLASQDTVPAPLGAFGSADDPFASFY